MRSYFPILVLLACGTAFVLGIVYLFELRFEAGDVYPPYSSLRADPLGAMAFYESLEQIPGVLVSRDFSASDQLPDAPHTAYLHLAADPFEWEGLPQDSYREIQDFITRGGRLVITFFPQTESFTFDEGTNAADRKMTPSKKVKKDQDNSDEGEDAWTSLEDQWDFHIGFQNLETNGDTYAPATVFNQTDLPLPDSLDWHSGIVFTNLSHSWRVIYSRGANAVVIERAFGRGSVVMASDSYFISNEAMLKDRHADFLAWLIGPGRNIVFDEAHFGIVKTPGIAALMRKYRLEGLAAGLVLLAGLFVWKNSLGLAPPLADGDAERVIAGRDSGAGFVNLLRRGIAPGKLLAVCFREWEKSVTQGGRNRTTRVQKAEAIFTAESNRSAVETYRKISETLGAQNQKL